MAENNDIVKEKVKEKKAKKQGPGAKAKISKFFRDYKSELKKVTWPTRKQVFNNTGITLITIAIIGAFIWILDLLLTLLRDLIFSIA